ncbi:MAG: hypothetical protein ACR2O0_03270 [Rhizobiaceae bacterium]
MIAFSAIAAAVATSDPAQAYESFPACQSPAVESKIIERFNWAEANTWYDGIRIVHIDRAVERPTSEYGQLPILRRYCRGRAHLENGHYRTIHFLIEDPMGFAGFGWNVEFCLSGHDRWRVYDGKCRVLRR